MGPADLQREQYLPLTTPLEALKRVMREHPDLVFFLDGMTDDELIALQHDEFDTQVVLTPEIMLKTHGETLGADPENTLNEDAHFRFPLGNGRFLEGVIDGSTSKKEVPGLHGLKGAWFISHLLAWFPRSPEYQTLLEQFDAADRQGTELPTSVDAMVFLNRWVRSRLEGMHIEGLDYTDTLTIPAASVTLAIYDAKRDMIDIADTADTMAIIEDVNGTFRIVTRDSNKAHNDAIFRAAEEIAQAEDTTFEQAIHTPTGRQRTAESSERTLNKPGGVGVVNGDEGLVEHGLIDRVILKMNDIHRVWLVSDGVMLGFAKFLNMAEEHGQVTFTREEVKRFRQKIQGGNHPAIDSLLLSIMARLREDPNYEEARRFKLTDDMVSLETAIIRAIEESSEHRGS